MIRRVMLMVAMEEEAQPLVEALKLQKRDQSLENLPTVIHEGEHQGGYVAVVSPGRDQSTGVNLIGTDAAALTTYLAARALQPDLIVSAGTCGGFNRTDGKVGDVFCVSSFQYHDRRIPIPGYDQFGRAQRTALPTCVPACLPASCAFSVSTKEPRRS